MHVVGIFSFTRYSAGISLFLVQLPLFGLVGVFRPCAFKDSLTVVTVSAARRLKCLGCSKAQICISLTFEQVSSRKVDGIIHENSYRKQNQH